MALKIHRFLSTAPVLFYQYFVSAPVASFAEHSLSIGIAEHRLSTNWAPSELRSCNISSILRKCANGQHCWMPNEHRLSTAWAPPERSPCTISPILRKGSSGCPAHSSLILQSTGVFCVNIEEHLRVPSKLVQFHANVSTSSFSASFNKCMLMVQRGGGGTSYSHRPCYLCHKQLGTESDTPTVTSVLVLV